MGAYQIVELLKRPCVDTSVNGGLNNFFCLLLSEDDYSEMTRVDSAAITGICSVSKIHPSQHELLVKGGLVKDDVVSVTRGDGYVVLVLLERKAFLDTGEYLYCFGYYGSYLNDTLVLDEATGKRTAIRGDRLILSARGKRHLTCDLFEKVTKVDELSTKPKAVRSAVVVGRVAYVSRIMKFKTLNVKRDPYFYVVILQSGAVYAKLYMFNKHYEIHPFVKTGSVILVENVAIKARLAGIKDLHFNTFAEVYHFEGLDLMSGGKTIVHTDVQASIPCSPGDPVFSTVSGVIVFMSCLYRQRQSLCDYLSVSDSVREYRLIRLADLKTGKDTGHVMLYANSGPEFQSLQIKDLLTLRNMRLIRRAGVLLYISSIFTEVVVTTGWQTNKHFDTAYNALGFVPDTFASLEENNKEEPIELGGASYTAHTYFKAIEATYDAVCGYNRNLVINETRKYCVRVRVLGYDLQPLDRGRKGRNPFGDVADAHIVYACNGEEEKQQAGVVFVETGEEEVCFLVFENMFYVNQLPDVDSFVGKACFAYIDCFRVNVEDVIVSLNHLSLV